MKYFTMASPFNDDLLEKFISFFNSYSLEPCIIILHTRGGSTYIAETFSLMVSQMADVTIVIHAAYSSGFDFAYKAKCKKILSSTARGMYHLGRIDISFGIDSKPYYDEDANHAKNFPVEMKISNGIAKKVMTKDEYQRFKIKREEIWFDFKRMKEIFPDAKILNT